MADINILPDTLTPPATDLFQATDSGHGTYGTAGSLYFLLAVAKAGPHLWDMAEAIFAKAAQNTAILQENFAAVCAQQQTNDYNQIPGVNAGSGNTSNTVSDGGDDSSSDSDATSTATAKMNSDLQTYQQPVRSLDNLISMLQNMITNITRGQQQYVQMSSSVTDAFKQAANLRI